MRFLLLFAFIFTIAACAALRPEVPHNQSVSSYEKKIVYGNSLSAMRSGVVSESKKCLGVKYRYAGKDTRGFDCSGFTSYVMNRQGVSISPSSSLQARDGEKISLRQAQAGDLLFFGTNGRINHVALIVSNSSNGIEVIHSTSSRGVIKENVSKSSYWAPRIMFARDVLTR